MGNPPIRKGSIAIRMGKGPVDLGKSPIQMGKRPMDLGKSPIRMGKSPICTRTPPTEMAEVPDWQWKAPSSPGTVPIWKGKGPGWLTRSPYAKLMGTRIRRIRWGRTSDERAMLPAGREGPSSVRLAEAAGGIGAGCLQIDRELAHEGGGARPELLV